jgi:hypothetical protein
MLKSYSPATGICYKADVQKFKNSKITELSWPVNIQESCLQNKIRDISLPYYTGIYY